MRKTRRGNWARRDYLYREAVRQLQARLPPVSTITVLLVSDWLCSLISRSICIKTTSCAHWTMLGGRSSVARAKIGIRDTRSGQIQSPDDESAFRPREDSEGFSCEQRHHSASRFGIQMSELCYRTAYERRDVPALTSRSIECHERSSQGGSLARYSDKAHRSEDIAACIEKTARKKDYREKLLTRAYVGDASSLHQDVFSIA